MAEIRIKLADLLRDRDMTQSRLAELSDVRPATISAMCRNNTVMLSLELLPKIMKALEIRSLDDILEYIE